MFTQPANIFKRVIAVIIDHAILLISFYAIYTQLWQGDINNVAVSTNQFIIFTAITIGYFFSLEWLFHKSIGKKIMGLKVIRITGQSPDLLSSLIRNIIRPIDFIGFYLLGLIFITYSDLNQRLGDMIAGTYVIEE